ncbi:hypothetical protein P154DRAFT_572069 [Amniculicola lignicola CBS 123094]|uniref:Uncharacterized protein n=1 Tax=Amniculicola lignicola CBS 123094 TaxID=1392246 RepID=A0A6A5WW83_9PLEO|nr:hypothetical protein P154DRAFT_572069 [Amniculicola lignicola CBS 123094]
MPPKLDIIADIVKRRAGRNGKVVLKGSAPGIPDIDSRRVLSYDVDEGWNAVDGGYVSRDSEIKPPKKEVNFSDLLDEAAKGDSSFQTTAAHIHARTQDALRQSRHPKRPRSPKRTREREVDHYEPDPRYVPEPQEYDTTQPILPALQAILSQIDASSASRNARSAVPRFEYNPHILEHMISGAPYTASFCKHCVGHTKCGTHRSVNRQSTKVSLCEHIYMILHWGTNDPSNRSATWKLEIRDYRLEDCIFSRDHAECRAYRPSERVRVLSERVIEDMGRRGRRGRRTGNGRVVEDEIYALLGAWEFGKLRGVERREREEKKREKESNDKRKREEEGRKEALEAQVKLEELIQGLKEEKEKNWAAVEEEVVEAVLQTVLDSMVMTTVENSEIAKHISVATPAEERSEAVVETVVTATVEEHECVERESAEQAPVAALSEDQVETVVENVVSVDVEEGAIVEEMEEGEIVEQEPTEVEQTDVAVETERKSSLSSSTFHVNQEASTPPPPASHSPTPPSQTRSTTPSPMPEPETSTPGLQSSTPPTIIIATPTTQSAPTSRTASLPSTSTSTSTTKRKLTASPPISSPARVRPQKKVRFTIESDDESDEEGGVVKPRLYSPPVAARDDGGLSPVSDEDLEDYVDWDDDSLGGESEEE